MLGLYFSKWVASSTCQAT